MKTSKLLILCTLITLASCDLAGQSSKESPESSCAATACFHNTIVPNQFVLDEKTYVFTGTKYEFESETRYSDLIAYWVNENEYDNYKNVLLDAPIIVDTTNSIYVYESNYGEIRYFDVSHETICVVTVTNDYCTCGATNILNREIRIYGASS